LCKNFVQRLEI
jgi:hypothetical protein